MMMMMIDVSFYAPITKTPRWRYPLNRSVPALGWLILFQAFRWMFEFFPRKLNACLKPPRRKNHRKLHVVKRLIELHNNVARMLVETMILQLGSS